MGLTGGRGGVRKDNSTEMKCENESENLFDFIVTILRLEPNLGASPFVFTPHKKQTKRPYVACGTCMNEGRYR